MHYVCTNYSLFFSSNTAQESSTDHVTAMLEQNDTDDVNLASNGSQLDHPVQVYM